MPPAAQAGGDGHGAAARTPHPYPVFIADQLFWITIFGNFAA